MTSQEILDKLDASGDKVLVTWTLNGDHDKTPEPMTVAAARKLVALVETNGGTTQVQRSER